MQPTFLQCQTYVLVHSGKDDDTMLVTDGPVSYINLAAVSGADAVGESTDDRQEYVHVYSNLGCRTIRKSDWNNAIRTLSIN